MVINDLVSSSTSKKQVDIGSHTFNCSKNSNSGLASVAKLENLNLETEDHTHYLKTVSCEPLDSLKPYEAATLALDTIWNKCSDFSSDTDSLNESSSNKSSSVESSSYESSDESSNELLDKSLDTSLVSSSNVSLSPSSIVSHGSLISVSSHLKHLTYEVHDSKIFNLKIQLPLHNF